MLISALPVKPAVQLLFYTASTEQKCWWCCTFSDLISQTMSPVSQWDTGGDNQLLTAYNRQVNYCTTEPQLRLLIMLTVHYSGIQTVSNMLDWFRSWLRLQEDRSALCQRWSSEVLLHDVNWIQLKIQHHGQRQQWLNWPLQGAVFSFPSHFLLLGFRIIYPAFCYSVCARKVGCQTCWLQCSFYQQWNNMKSTLMLLHNPQIYQPDGLFYPILSAPLPLGWISIKYVNSECRVYLFGTANLSKDETRQHQYGLLIDLR